MQIGVGKAAGRSACPDRQSRIHQCLARGADRDPVRPAIQRVQDGDIACGNVSIQPHNDIGYRTHRIVLRVGNAVEFANDGNYLSSAESIIEREASMHPIVVVLIKSEVYLLKVLRHRN